MGAHEALRAGVLGGGGGGAGCRAAMTAADAGAQVIVIEKERIGITGSAFDSFTRSKGIIAAVRGYNPTDGPEVHYREAMAAARGLANPALVKAVAYDAPGPGPGALLRAESRGPHYRTDYPVEDESVGERNLVWGLERGTPAPRWDRPGSQQAGPA